jgi:protein TonB
MIVRSGDRLRTAIGISLALHLAGFLFLWAKSMLIPARTLVIPPSLRVDLVGLPDQKPAESVPVEPAKPEPAGEPATAPAPAPAPEPDGMAGLRKSAKELIRKKKKEPSKKEKSAQKKLKKALARIRALERIKALAGESKAKGNRVSKGSSLTGEAKRSLEETYFEVVLERVRTHWELPKWLREQNRSARVMIRLDGQGRIRNFEFVQSSGSEPFDTEVRRALQSAAPFPVPPEGISSDLSREGIVLGFPL